MPAADGSAASASALTSGGGGGGGRRPHEDDDDDRPPPRPREPPVIDLSSIRSSSAARQVYDACRTFGFFQVTGHGVDPRLVDDLRSEARRFFVGAPRQAKERLRRSQDNARGYFDDELTRRKRDWKECLDAGVPGSRSWGAPDDGPANACLDGCNRFPHDGPGGRQRLREAFVAYFEACSRLSGRIAALMAAGLLGSAADGPSGRSALEQASDEFLRRMKDEHTSYLRLNYYPPCRPGEGEKGRRANTDATRMKEDEEEDDEEEDNAPRPLGISPHRDAGFLTVLLQDDDCHSLQVWDDRCGTWCTVVPVPGALTVNTGDMAQVWSNGVYKAPLHRVLTHDALDRFSAPFFYNPGYATWVAPLPWNIKETPGAGRREEGSDGDEDGGDDPSQADAAMAPPALRYHPVLWGYFRAVRFAGDLADLGVEIQVSDFEISSDPSSPARHVGKQKRFAEACDFSAAFSVEAHRDLLQE